MKYNDNEIDDLAVSENSKDILDILAAAKGGLRFGQLIINALPKGVDLFYVTDEELFAYIDDFIEKLYQA